MRNIILLSGGLSLLCFNIHNAFVAYLMKKDKQIRGFGQGQKFLSDPGVLTINIGCNGRHVTRSLANVTRTSENDVKVQMRRVLR